MNFNMVKKPKKDEDDVIEEEEDLEESHSSDDAKRRMFRFMGFIFGGMFLLFLILYIASLFSKQSTYSYKDIETIMRDAAISYFKDNPSSLPKNENSLVSISASTLAQYEKMEPLENYLEEGVTCQGTVEVERSGDQYLYTPKLDCGEKYRTIELSKKIMEDNQIVSAGYGLYAINGNYVYRGELVNNYVKLDKSLWRIVKIFSDNTMMLVHAEGISFTQPWDDRYNEIQSYGAGINQYSASRVREYLQRIYDNPVEEYDELILSERDKAKLIYFNLCTGKRAYNSQTKDNSEECREMLSNQKLGLLTLSDYMSVSIDPSCVSADSYSCQNYNYLAINTDWWLVTASTADSSYVFVVTQSGSIKEETAASYAAVRPVIYLNSNVLYKSGKGTEEKPYTVR